MVDSDKKGAEMRVAIKQTLHLLLSIWYRCKDTPMVAILGVAQKFHLLARRQRGSSEMKAEEINAQQWKLVNYFIFGNQ